MNEQALRRRIDDWLDAELGTQGGARTSVQDDTQFAMTPDDDPHPERAHDQVLAAMALGSRLRRRGHNRTAGLVTVAASVLVGSVMLLPGDGAVDTAVIPTVSVSSTGPASSTDPVTPAVPKDLAEARRRWASSGLRDYTVTVRTSCYCPATGTVTVTYRDGLPVATTPPADPSTSAELERQSPTSVERLFAIIAAEQATAERVSVFYEANGVPAVIEVDRVLNAVDDDISYTTWVRPLVSPAPSAAAAAATPVRYRTDAGLVEVLWPGPASAPSWLDLSGDGPGTSTTDGARDLLAALDRAVPGTARDDPGTATVLDRRDGDPAGYTTWVTRVAPDTDAADDVTWGLTMSRGGMRDPMIVFDPCGRWPEPDGLGLDDGSTYFEEYLSDATETCAVTTKPDGRRVVRFTIVPGIFKETPLPGPQLRAFTVRPDGTAVAAAVLTLPGTPASTFEPILERLTELVLDVPYPSRP